MGERKKKGGCKVHSEDWNEIMHTKKENLSYSWRPKRPVNTTAPFAVLPSPPDLFCEKSLVNLRPMLGEMNFLTN